MASDKPVLTKVVDLRHPRFVNDIAGTLREIADQIEAEEISPDVIAITIITEGEVPTIYAAGPQSSVIGTVGALGIAKTWLESASMIAD